MKICQKVKYPLKANPPQHHTDLSVTAKSRVSQLVMKTLRRTQTAQVS